MALSAAQARSAQFATALNARTAREDGAVAVAGAELAAKLVKHTPTATSEPESPPVAYMVRAAITVSMDGGTLSLNAGQRLDLPEHVALVADLHRIGVDLIPLDF